jgi:hypothetical protein
MGRRAAASNDYPSASVAKLSRKRISSLALSHADSFSARAGHHGSVTVGMSSQNELLHSARRPHSQPESCHIVVVGMTEEGWAQWTEGSPMSVDFLLVHRPARASWNKGRIIGQKRPLLPQHVWSIRVRLEMTGNARDLALFNMAEDSKLRGCDLVGLRVRDVFAAGRIKERTSMMQSKTKSRSGSRSPRRRGGPSNAGFTIPK